MINEMAYIQKTMLKEKSLNIVCPECQIEHDIKDYFESEDHFISAMGAVVNHLGDKFNEQLNDLVAMSEINSLRLIMNPNCQLLKQALYGEEDDLSESAKILRKIYEHNKDRLDAISEESKKLEELAKLNLILQAAYLQRNSLLDLKVGSGLLKIKGLLYHEENGEFEEIFNSGQ